MELCNFSKDDVAGEAIKCLYGTNRKQDINLSKNTALIMPTFEAISKYIYTEAHLIVNENKKCFTIGNHVLPFNVRAYVEVLRLLLKKKLLTHCIFIDSALFTFVFIQRAPNPFGARYSNASKRAYAHRS